LDVLNDNIGKRRKWGDEVLKRLMLTIVSACFLAACSVNGETKTPTANIEETNVDVERANIEITKEFVEENAKMNLTIDEVKEIFGEPVLEGESDGTDMLVYDSITEEGFTYGPNFQEVAKEEIKEGKLGYQLYIVFVDGKSYMYDYFHEGDDGTVWLYSVAANGLEEYKTSENN